MANQDPIRSDVSADGVDHVLCRTKAGEALRLSGEDLLHADQRRAVRSHQTPSSAKLASTVGSPKVLSSTAAKYRPMSSMSATRCTRSSGHAHEQAAPTAAPRIAVYSGRVDGPTLRTSVG
jgi:hypothetical protein